MESPAHDYQMFYGYDSNNLAYASGDPRSNQLRSACKTAQRMQATKQNPTFAQSQQGHIVKSPEEELDTPHSESSDDDYK